METAGKGRRVKRKQVVSDDGWTVVAGSGSRGAVAEGAAGGTENGGRPTRVVDGMTVERLAREFGGLEKRWRKSECWKSLERMLGLREWTVEAAVCIGIGSFSLDWENRWRSMWQLVLFTNVVRVLKQESREMLLYAQEPVFTPLDVALLSRLSIEVVADGAEAKIMPSSFVYAPFVDWYLLLPRFLKGKDPELYIGVQILEDYSILARSANVKEKDATLKEANEVAAMFVKSRERRKLPLSEDAGSALEGLTAYWREDVDEDE